MKSRKEGRDSHYRKNGERGTSNHAEKKKRSKLKFDSKGGSRAHRPGEYAGQPHLSTAQASHASKKQRGVLDASQKGLLHLIPKNTDEHHLHRSPSLKINVGSIESGGGPSFREKKSLPRRRGAVGYRERKKRFQRRNRISKELAGVSKGRRGGGGKDPGPSCGHKRPCPNGEKEREPGTKSQEDIVGDRQEQRGRWSCRVREEKKLGAEMRRGGQGGKAHLLVESERRTSHVEGPSFLREKGGALPGAHRKCFRSLSCLKGGGTGALRRGG